MALSPTRYEYRITLAQMDSSRHVEETVVAARHPSETAEHLVLRVLGYCLLHRDGLEFGPGLSDGAGADLQATTPDGRLALWVECGTAELDKVRRVASQNAEAEVHAVFAGPRRRDELLSELAAHDKSKKGLDRVRLWTFDAAFIAELVRHEGRRQKWTITIADGHCYAEIDGESCDGVIESAGLI